MSFAKWTSKDSAELVGPVIGYSNFYPLNHLLEIYSSFEVSVVSSIIIVAIKIMEF